MLNFIGFHIFIFSITHTFRSSLDGLLVLLVTTRNMYKYQYKNNLCEFCFANAQEKRTKLVFRDFRKFCYSTQKKIMCDQTPSRSQAHLYRIHYPSLCLLHIDYLNVEFYRFSHFHFFHYLYTPAVVVLFCHCVFVGD